MVVFGDVDPELEAPLERLGRLELSDGDEENNEQGASTEGGGGGDEGEGGVSPTDTLPVEMKERVCSFIPNCADYSCARKLHILASRNEQLRNSIEYEIVFRAALNSGWTVSKALENVMELVMKRAIHKPSPWRVLRVVIGTSCECAGKCLEYDEENARGADLTKSPARPFGLCICRACRVEMSAHIGDQDDTWWKSHPRVAHVNGSRLLQPAEYLVDSFPHLMDGFLLDSFTREKVGPVVSSQDFLRVKARRGSQEQCTRALETLLQERCPESDNDKTSLAQLHGLYSQVKAEHDRRQEARKLQRKQEMIRALEENYETIHSELADYKWKDIALEGTRSRDDESYTFSFGPSTDILGRFVTRPRSVASRHSILKALVVLRKVYDVLASSGFFPTDDATNFVFLPFLDGDLADTALREYCLRKYSTWRSMLGDRGSWRGSIGMLQAGRPAAAVCELLGALRLKDAFAEKMPKDPYAFTVLARSIWESPRVVGPGTADAYERFRAKFWNCYVAHMQKVLAFVEYFYSPETQAWLDDTTAAPWVRGGRPASVATRHRTITITLVRPDLGEQYLDDRNFAALRALHQTIFNEPGWFRIRP